MSQPELAAIGSLQQDYYVTHLGRIHVGVLGGNACYAAAGARLWARDVGVFGRVGADFPAELLAKLQSLGVTTSFVRRLDLPHSPRQFVAYLSPGERVIDNPSPHFRKAGAPLPKELLDYLPVEPEARVDRGLTPLAYRPEDLPATAGSLRGAHLTPAEYGTHALVPVRLRELGVRLITLDPSPAYMRPAWIAQLRTIVNGLDAFLPSLEEAQALFLSQATRPREIAEALGAMGCRFVVLKRGPSGQMVWDSEARREWSVPAYPARVVDLHGVGDVYCGAFLAGLAQTSDVVEAALMGSVAASLAAEGSGPGYLLDALPGLPQARLEALRPGVRAV